MGASPGLRSDEYAYGGYGGFVTLELHWHRERGTRVYSYFLGLGVAAGEERDYDSDEGWEYYNSIWPIPVLGLCVFPRKPPTDTSSRTSTGSLEIRISPLSVIQDVFDIFPVVSLNYGIGLFPRSD